MPEREDAMLLEIREIVRTVGKIPAAVPISANSRLSEDLGIDSLDQVTVVMRVEDRFEVEVDDDDLRGLHTVGDLADYVASHRASVAA